MTIGFNIWMICLILHCFFYDPSRMLQLSKFAWTLRYSVHVVFKIFLLIDATDRSKISSDQKRLFFAVNLYPLSFFANTPFNKWKLDRSTNIYSSVEKCLKFHTKTTHLVLLLAGVRQILQIQRAMGGREITPHHFSSDHKKTLQNQLLGIALKRSPL